MNTVIVLSSLFIMVSMNDLLIDYGSVVCHVGKKLIKALLRGVKFNRWLHLFLRILRDKVAFVFNNWILIILDFLILLILL